MQGEDQKKLDVVSNEVFKNCLASCGRTVRLLRGKLLHGSRAAEAGA